MTKPKKKISKFNEMQIEAFGDKFRMKSVEVFRAGDYGEGYGAWTEADLDTAIADYNVKLHEAPITINHEDKTGPLGWVEKVYRKGKSLFTDLTNISEDGLEKIKSIKKRSAELYRDFEGSGKPYLRAVSFVAIPRVKGMADILDSQISAMSDDKGEFFFCDMWDDDYESAPILGRPSGATQATIINSAITGVTRSHYHDCDLAEGNDGFTGAACNYSDGYFGDDHQHVIKAGIVMESKDAKGVLHTHSLSIFQISDSNGTEGMTSMAEKETPIVAPVVAATPSPEVAKFAEENKKLQDEVASLRKRDADRTEREEMSLFNEVFGDSTKETTAPSVRGKALSVFNMIRRGEKVAKFSDDKGASIDVDGVTAFLDYASAGRKLVEVGSHKFAEGRTLTAEVPESERNDGGNMIRTEEVKKFMEDHKVNYAEALSSIGREREAKARAGK